MNKLILYKDNKNQLDVIEEKLVVINNKKVYQNNKCLGEFVAYISN